MSDSTAVDGGIFEESPSDDELESPLPPRARPKGVEIVCIVAFILGGSGLLVSATGLASSVFARKFQTTMAGPAGVPPELQQAQAEMNAQVMEIVERYRWISLPLISLKLAVEVALLLATVRTWRLQERGRKLLIRVLWIALVLETLQVFPGIVIQIETQAVTREFMQKIMTSRPGAPQQASQVATKLVQGLAVVSLVIAIGWMVLKDLYYGLAARYLARPEIAAQFRAAESGEPA
ncbi:MAG: hypothetical protein JSS02_28535 [Planctomycetes bacterium]|nr:hypothetical protein [Planctomycetota bacterium]